jgi:hypothetical protein
VKRRAFIAGLASAAAWPVARAQQPDKVRRLGVLILRRPIRWARITSAILVNKPPVRSFSPATTPTPWAEALGSTASRHPL